MLSLTGADASALSAHATAAIGRALLKGGARSAAPWDEVSAVKAVVFDAFDEIALTWGPVLAAGGYRLEVTSVFTHCRPHVVSSAGTCELADLLVVIDDDSGTGAPADRRALLIQAKTLKKGSGIIKLAPKELKQFHLLSGWPSFTFTEPDYCPRSRDFTAATCPGDAHFAGEYGAIDLHAAPRTWEQWLTAAPIAFTGNEPLGDFLVKMAAGVHMYGREAIPGGTDDWSFTVDELLNVTALKPVVKKSRPLRGNAHVLEMLTVDDAVGPPWGRIPAEREGWGVGPISVVRLLLSPSKEAPR